MSATGRGVQLLGVLLCVLLLTATEHSSCVAGSTATRRSSCVADSASKHRCFRLCEVSAPLCRGYWFCHYRPCPEFLRFLSLRFLRCRLVSLTSVLKDSVCAADSALDSTPWFVCPVLISSLFVLLEEYGPISRGAGSPDASPVSSSLSMGTIPKEDQSALVPSDSDPDPPLKPTVESDPDDDVGAACCDHSGLEHMPSMANPFAISFPCTLTCAGTCSHLTSRPGVAISQSRISQTGTWTCSFPYEVVHPFDFQCWALPVTPNCRYCKSVRIASFGTQNPCKASTAAQSSAPLFVCL